MTYTLRITKYNPSYRTKTGVYTKNEWTSYGDIGKKIDNKVFLLKEYLLTEQSYIEVCVEAMKELGIKRMEVKYLSKQNIDKLSLNNSKLKEFYEQVDNRTWLNVEQIEMFLKLVLRDCIWGFLDSGKRGGKKLMIHIEYDYYMYFILNSRLTQTNRLTNKRKLYADRLPAYWDFM